MSLRIEELERAWFEGKRYTPRLPSRGKTEWFLLEKRFRPITRVPTERAVEPWAGREKLHAAFEATYRGWGLSRTEAIDRSLETIRSPESAVIVTGQQPAFLGGPLLVLFKALTAVAAARKYEAATGRPCVPVFWVAGDDHDLDEIRSAHFPGGAGEDSTFTYPALADRRPVADYPMDEDSLRLLDALHVRLAGRRFGDLTKDIADLYRGRDLAGAFAAVVSKLLERTGLLIIDPVRLRPLAGPLWRRVIESPGELTVAIEIGDFDRQVAEATLRKTTSERVEEQQASFVHRVVGHRTPVRERRIRERRIFASSSGEVSAANFIQVVVVTGDPEDGYTRAPGGRLVLAGSRHRRERLEQNEEGTSEKARLLSRHNDGALGGANRLERPIDGLGSRKIPSAISCLESFMQLLTAGPRLVGPLGGNAGDRAETLLEEEPFRLATDEEARRAAFSFEPCSLQLHDA